MIASQARQIPPAQLQAASETIQTVIRDLVASERDLYAAHQGFSKHLFDSLHEQASRIPAEVEHVEHTIGELVTAVETAVHWPRR